MGNVNIAGLAKLAVQQQTQSARAESSQEDGTIDFSDFMGQITTQAQEELFTQDTFSGLASSVGDTKKSAEVSCDTYQYRKSEIKTQDLAKEQPEEQKITDELERYTDDVKEVIEESLDVTEEQIEEAMEALGISYLDLTDPQQLARLTAQLTGSEDMAVLFDSDFMQLMQDVGELGHTLLETLGVAADELKELVSAMENVSAMDADGIAEMLADSQTMQDVSAEMVDTEWQEAVVEHGDESVMAGEVLQEGSRERAADMQEAKEPIKEETVKNAAEETVKDAAEETADSAGEEVKDSFVKDSSKQNTSQNGQLQNPLTQNGAASDAQTLQAEITEVPVTEGSAGSMEQVDTADVIRQIVTYAQTHVTEQTTTLEMQLNPEHLGKLYLQVTSEEGTVSARILAQNEVVKEALEAQMAELRENMNQAGIKVDTVEVSVEPHAFERNLEEQADQEQKQAEEQERTMRQTRRINLNELSDLEGLAGVMTEEETLVARMMADQGNSIDFTA